MRCNGFVGVGTNAVILRPHDRHVVGKIRAIALVWRQRRPGRADRLGYRPEVIVWLGKDDQPSWSVFETRKRHLSRKKPLQQSQCGILPVFGRQKRRVDGHVRGDTETRCRVMLGAPRIDQWLSLGRHQEEPHEPSLQPWMLTRPSL